MRAVLDMVVLSIANMMGNRKSLSGSLTMVLYACSYQLPELTSPNLPFSDTYLEKGSLLLTTKFFISFMFLSCKSEMSMLVKLQHTTLRMDVSVGSSKELGKVTSLLNGLIVLRLLYFFICIV